MTIGFWVGMVGLAALAWSRWAAARKSGALAKRVAELDVALEEERDRWAAVMTGMKAGVLVLDARSHIVLFNPAAAELIGPDCKAGIPVAQALPQPELAGLLATLAQAPQGAAQLETAGPPARTLLARAGAQRTSGGVVLVLHDITEVQRLEQVRQTFVANVSHELRTPLSVIRANSEALIDGAWKDPVAAREFLDATLRHTERLSHLVADLLDLSRIEAGALELDVRTFTLSPVVQGALEVVSGRAGYDHR